MKDKEPKKDIIKFDKGDFVIEIETTKDDVWRALKILRSDRDLVRFLVYIMVREPITMTDLSLFATRMSLRVYNRSKVYTIVRKLSDVGLVKFVTAMDVEEDDLPEDMKKMIKTTYNRIISKLPPILRKSTNIRNMKFLILTKFAKEKIVPRIPKLLNELQIDDIKINFKRIGKK